MGNRVTALHTINPQEIAVIRRIHRTSTLENALLTRFSTARLALVSIACAALFALAPAARAEMPAGQTIDEISCDTSEGAVFHIHQHITILDHGKPIDIPSDVGRPETGTCLYWMHTHTPDGIVHVESPKVRTFTLGEFFDIWGQPLSATEIGPVIVKKGQTRVYLDGRPFHGDPRAIEMTLHADIVLEAGAPFSKPAPFTDWQGN
jgi:hypothetical protein